ncbi:hypothetical protein L249_4039 [Ophiocordyceps polyrhachis-furcata BCC 54312]|uniref:Uncharacterized protein n=1 Tax=Ophiocordyceps polyrhachis-furcata BCC 54312 TaxID=1330021 RepID=A0A367L5T9_9HYPO|nr:hypothetical protein L249_4039 [Ophiocordyceps polyrhachis-furcata BCC 54312]
MPQNLSSSGRCHSSPPPSPQVLLGTVSCAPRKMAYLVLVDVIFSLRRLDSSKSSASTQGIAQSKEPNLRRSMPEIYRM